MQKVVTLPPAVFQVKMATYWENQSPLVWISTKLLKMFTGTARLLGCFCMSGPAHKTGLTILMGYKIQHLMKTFLTILVPKTLTWLATNYNAGLTVDELSIINCLHIERKYNQGCKTNLRSLPWRFTCNLEHLEEWRFKRVTYKKPHSWEFVYAIS